MKAYKVTILVIDHDGLGADGIEEVLENTRYPNHCVSPKVMWSQEAEIGEWHDDHPLNKYKTMYSEFDRLFGLSINRGDF